MFHQSSPGAELVMYFNDLHKRFGETVALDGLSFSVPQGVIFGFLGPNGSGKTTTVRALVRLVRLDRGEIIFQGSSLLELDRSLVGYMPEERGLYPKMTVLDHLRYIGSLYGYSRSEARSRANLWIERLGLGVVAKNRIETLSLGNKQRVQLAATFVHDPAILALDEPFSGLDPIATEAVKEVLADSARQGRYVIFSSHQLDLVESFCEQAAIIDRGRCVLSGDVATLLETNPKVFELTVGDGPGVVEKLRSIAGVTVISQSGGHLELSLAAGGLSQEVLRVAMLQGEVVAFGFRRHRLSEAFVQAIASERDGRQ